MQSANLLLQFLLASDTLSNTLWNGPMTTEAPSACFPPFDGAFESGDGFLNALQNFARWRFGGEAGGA